MLAQTGGEIEKLTADLKNCKKSDVSAQSNKPKDNHGDDFNKDIDVRVDHHELSSDEEGEKERHSKNIVENSGRNSGRESNVGGSNDVNAQSKRLKHNHGGFNNDLRMDENDSGEEDEKNIGDSDEDVNSEKENERENNILDRVKGIYDSDTHEQNKKYCNGNDLSKNEEDKIFDVVYDLKKTGKYIDKEQRVSNKEDDVKEEGHEVEVLDSSDDEDGMYTCAYVRTNTQVYLEIMGSCSIILVQPAMYRI